MMNNVNTHFLFLVLKQLIQVLINLQIIGPEKKHLLKEECETTLIFLPILSANTIPPNIATVLSKFHLLLTSLLCSACSPESGSPTSSASARTRSPTGLARVAMYVRTRVSSSDVLFFNLMCPTYNVLRAHAQF